MPGRLGGKVAIVTGAARGIGEAHARVFAEEGASVVITDVLDREGEKLAADLRADGLAASYRNLDVSSDEAWQAVVAETVAEFGALTTLVNNAAIFNAAGLEETTPEDWNRLTSVNLTGTFLGMRAAAPALRASGNGSIINIASLFAMVATTGYTSYHASKGGVRMLSKASALEYAKRGVRINSVYPGDTDTPAQGNLTAEERAGVLANVPMGYEADPRDIAYASLYLASDEARYVTGAEIVVDGGWSLP
jgi:NAD(P)-dependent dehydrogenase (short-subunit alcohol dehydrogenase family)